MARISPSALREALLRAIRSPEPPLPRGVTVSSTDYRRRYKLGGDDYTLSLSDVSRNARNSRIMDTSWFGWTPDRGKAARSRKALSVMRAVGAALEYDAARHKPKGYTFSATSFSRANLYDKMMERAARKAGYAPTLLTRGRKGARGALRTVARLGGVRPDELPPELNDIAELFFRDTYKRKGSGAAVRGALTDIASPGVPGALLLALQDERDG